MQKILTNRYPISADRYWKDLYFDHRFNHALYLEGMGCLKFQILSESPFPNYKRSILSQPKLEIPAAIQRVLGSSISYTEKGSFDPSSNSYSFDIIPSTLSNKISISGNQSIRSTGPEEIESIVELQFSVKIFGIGKVLEKFILQSNVENQRKAAEFTKKWIKEMR